MKNHIKTLIVALVFCSPLAKAATMIPDVHDIVGTAGAGTVPFDYYTDTAVLQESVSFTSGEVHWQMFLVNYQQIDQDHFIGRLSQWLISGTPNENYVAWDSGSTAVLRLLASQMGIQEYHEDVNLNNKSDAPDVVRYLDITVPDNAYSLLLLLGTTSALIGWRRFYPRFGL